MKQTILEPAISKKVVAGIGGDDLFRSKPISNLSIDFTVEVAHQDSYFRPIRVFSHGLVSFAGLRVLASDPLMRVLKLLIQGNHKKPLNHSLLWLGMHQASPGSV
jgi:hypothetical protein